MNASAAGKAKKMKSAVAIAGNMDSTRKKPANVAKKGLVVVVVLV